MTPNVLQPSEDQAHVLAEMLSWLKKKIVLTLTIGGYAGTGKTTLISTFRLQLKEISPYHRVAFVCFTGKASQVLKQKLLEQHALFSKDFCGTIHSLLYSPKLDAQNKIVGWTKVSELDYDLLIVDEASMVTADVWRDLTSYQLPIIAIGDHGQLPPIDSDFNLMSSPLLKLEKIHRQETNNPILDVAVLARTTGKIPFQTFGGSAYAVRKVSAQHDDIEELFRSTIVPYSRDTLVLCARNKTRIQLNQQIRSWLGYTSPSPQPGETVICLKNNYAAEGGPIYNGMVGTLLQIQPQDEHWYTAQILFHDDDRIFSGKISKHQFNHPTSLEDVKGVKYADIGDRFDFGYALTVHKAQGSQAKSVVLFEEYSPYMSTDQWKRWLYTAVTRASEQLLIIC